MRPSAPARRERAASASRAGSGLSAGAARPGRAPPGVAGAPRGRLTPAAFLAGSAAPAALPAAAGCRSPAAMAATGCGFFRGLLRCGGAAAPPASGCAPPLCVPPLCPWSGRTGCALGWARLGAGAAGAGGAGAGVRSSERSTAAIERKQRPVAELRKYTSAAPAGAHARPSCAQNTRAGAHETASPQEHGPAASVAAQQARGAPLELPLCRILASTDHSLPRRPPARATACCRRARQSLARAWLSASPPAAAAPPAPGGSAPAGRPQVLQLRHRRSIL